MSRLSLGLDARKIFGEYLPSVFIDQVIISNPPDEATGLPNIDGTTNIDVTATISFEKPPDYDGDMETWISDQYGDLYLTVSLSPFEDLNTQLEESNLSMWDYYNACRPPAPTDLTSSWPGFDAIINYMKEFFINNWLDSAYCEGETDGIAWTDEDRRTGLADLNSDIARAFWGPSTGQINTEGPWLSTDGFVGENISDFLAFIDPTYSATHWGTKQFWASLPDLASGTGGMGSSKVVTEGYYDSNGNEIVKIEDIKFRLEYDTETIPTGITKRLNNTKKLFLIGSVCHQDVNTNTDPPSLFDAGFGDISYEHILEYNQVPDQTETIFKEIESGELFNGKPIQSFDRKYFVPHPVDQSTIITSLENLIKNMEPWAKTDKRLEKATTQLKALLLDKTTATDLLVELKKFSIALPHKDFGSPPGKFFKSLQDIINAFNESVTKQLQLSRNLAYNVTVIDDRPPPLKNTYLPPTTRILSAEYSNDFIPSNWAMMSRYVEQTLPVEGLLTDFVEFALAEGFSADYDVPTGGGRLEDASDEEKLGKALEAFEYYSSDAGYTDSWVQNNMDVFADQVVANKGIWFFDYEKALYTKSTISQVFNVRKLQDLFHYTIPYEYFFCTTAEMERVEADLTLNNTVPAEEDGFTGHIPDDTNTIKLETSLWDGAAGGAPRWPQSRWTSYDYKSNNLKYGQPFVYTFGKIGATYSGMGGGGAMYTEDFTDWSGEVLASAPMFQSDLDPAAVPATSSGVSETESDMMGVPSSPDGGWSIMTDFMEWVDEDSMRTGDATDYSYMKSMSFLKYVCFDVANPEYNERLEGFGNYDIPNFRTDFPRGPRGTYRMLAFQYRDYMDDDVAYYNTWGSFYGGRNGEYIAQMMMGAEYIPPSTDHPLEPSVPGSDYTIDTYGADATTKERYHLNDVWTGYTMELRMRDRTVKVIDDIYEVGEDALNELIRYQELANEICSYNNITGAFNEFFTEGVLKYYEEGGIKPWIQAAYVYNALRELLFASFSDSADAPTDMDKLLEDTRLIADSIGPVNGTVANIQSFVTKLKLVLHNIYPQTGYSGGAAVIFRAWENSAASLFGIYDTSDWGDDPNLLMEEMKKAWQTWTHARFSNFMPITKMIYGNLALAAYWEDGYSDFVPPTCASAYMDPDKSLSDRVAAFLGCISYPYRASLPDWCKTRAGGEDVDASAFGASGTKLWSAFRWSIITIAFLNEFQSEINELYNSMHSTGGSGEDLLNPFYNEDRFVEFFSADPWNLDTLSPWLDGETTWMEIFRLGMKYLFRFNNIDYSGTLTDTWIPTDAWNQDYTTAGRVTAGNPWSMKFVLVEKDFLDTYGDSWDDEDDPEPDDVTYFKLPAFYWLEWEITVSGEHDYYTRTWTESDGDFSGSEASDGFPFDAGTYTTDGIWTTKWYDGAQGYFNWEDQFQFDLGIVSAYETGGATGIALNGTPIAPPKHIHDP